jgi:hypothetical protein
VEGLAVLAQALAVVGRDHEQGLFAQAQPAQGLVEATDQLVRKGHLAVVEPARIAGGIRLRRLVGIVGIVEVQPQEGARRGRPLASDRLEPGHRGPGGDVTLLLERAQELGLAGPAFEARVVDLEAAVEPGGRIEHDRRNEGPGPEPRALQDFGEQRGLRDHGRRHVVAHAGLVGQAAGEKADVGGPGQGDVRGGLHGEGTVARDRVEVRGRDLVVAVDPEPVGTEGVDGHEHEVARADDRPRRRCAATRGEEECSRQQRAGMAGAQPPLSSLRAAAASRSASTIRPWRL